MSADSDLYRLRLNLHETEELIAVFVLRNRKYTLFNQRHPQSRVGVQKVWVGPDSSLSETKEGQTSRS